MEITKAFKKSKINFPWVIPQMIGREWDTTGVNIAIAKAHGPMGLQAIDDIRMADEAWGKPPLSQMRFNDIPKGSSDWSEGQKMRWKRLFLWQQWAKPKPMKATLLWSRGYRIAEIEREVKISQGHGYGKKNIIEGSGVYVEIMRMESEKVSEAETIERINLLRKAGRI